MTPQLSADTKKNIIGAILEALNDTAVWELLDSMLSEILSEAQISIMFSDGVVHLAIEGKGDFLITYPLRKKSDIEIDICLYSPGPDGNFYPKQLNAMLSQKTALENAIDILQEKLKETIDHLAKHVKRER